VATTKTRARPTATDWANVNQSFLSMIEIVESGDDPRGDWVADGVGGTPYRSGARDSKEMGTVAAPGAEEVDISELHTPAGSSVSGPRAVARADVLAWLDSVLRPQEFEDYCPNGLQVEGAATVARVVCAVTASLRVLQAAARMGAQLVLVHHGWFWRGEDLRLIGTRRARMAAALAADLNLVAYHLPLDVHPEWGNNVQLAERLGWPAGVACGRRGLLRMAELPVPCSAGALQSQVAAGLDRVPLVVGERGGPVQRLVWCTGGAADALQEAIDLGAHAYLTGEITERTTHLAREAGVLCLAAGHHATERYGVQALGRALGRQFDVAVWSVEDPNPV
jgi:dinuclear metal center YbgI/SA1388 family protein